MPHRLASDQDDFYRGRIEMAPLNQDLKDLATHGRITIEHKERIEERYLTLTGNIDSKVLACAARSFDAHARRGRPYSPTRCMPGKDQPTP